MNQPNTDPRRFLFTTLPSNDLGLLTRTLPVAAALAARGHQVVCCNPAEAPRKLIAEASLANYLPRHALYYLMGEQMTLPGLYRGLRRGGRELGWGTLLSQLLSALPTRVARPTPRVWSLDHLGAMIGLLNENFVRANCDALIDLMAAYRPDAVVDSWNPFACIAARALQIPLVSIIQADMHPASGGFIWWEEAPKDLPTTVPVINRVRARYDLPPISKVEALHVGDMTLVVGTPETDPLPQEAGVSYIGPILWQKPGAALPDWVDELDRERPLIWVYPGNPRYMAIPTPMDSATIVHACVAALGDRDVQVVLTTGHHPLPKGTLPLPANFYHRPFLPGLAMAERSDLLIHHGGYGSCQTGLYTGTPAVILPNFSERESNARRVVAVGAGEMVLPAKGQWGRRRLPVDELWAKVSQVLSNRAYRANAQRVSEQMRAYGGAAEAAQKIEAFARSRGYS